MNNKCMFLLVQISILAICYAQTPTGSVGEFLFNGSLNDNSSLAVHATAQGTPNFSEDRFGELSAIRFDGIDDKLTATSDNRGVTNIVSVSIWVNTSAAKNQWIIGKYNAPEQGGFVISMNEGAPGIRGRDGSGNFIDVVGSEKINDGKWHHLVGVVEGTDWRFYVDKILISSHQSSFANPNYTSSSNLCFAEYKWNQYYSGKLDDARIYTFPLTTSHIEALYHENGYIGNSHKNEITANSITAEVITAKQMMITPELSIKIPDYVFEPNYELPNLKVVEAYVKTHKHLPEIQSASEMVSGTDLFNLNMLFLKKIEELTLYTIAQQHRLDSLDHKIDALMKTSK